ncbi:hypothetical protein MKD50_14395 [Cupriavidus sp. WGtm5]|uniref:hypothetical protein n=1 Tax=Cupriavidus TaxID=106589 RepID=UPI001F03166B|nr:MULTISPECIES: hypothetical protein [Cupriavidus]MCO4890565.1 hypothetical protein [Cupriavidus sp. WGtm5]
MLPETNERPNTWRAYHKLIISFISPKHSYQIADADQVIGEEAGNVDQFRIGDVATVECKEALSRA